MTPLDANGIAQRGGPEAVRAAFDAAAVRAPRPSASLPARPATDGVIIEASPYTWRNPASIPPRSWLYARHYIRRFLSVTIAPGGVGKSSLAVVEALAMVSGRDLLGVAPRPPLRIWLWNGEDPAEEMARRIQAAAAHHRLGPEDIGDRLFVDSGRDTAIIIATDEISGARLAVPVVDAVKRTIERNRIDALMVDPFVASHAVSENDNGRIALVARAWADIADATNCSVELIHHPRKNGGGELTAEDARGAGALVAAARSVRALNRMTDDEAAKAGVAERRRHFRVEDVKANLAPPADVATWRELVSVDLGNGTADRPEDHVGVVRTWRWPDAFEDVTVADREEVQRRVGLGDWRADARSDAWVGKLVAEVLQVDLSSDSIKEKVKRIVATWMNNGALRKEQRLDSRRHLKEFIVAGATQE